LKASSAFAAAAFASRPATPRWSSASAARAYTANAMQERKEPRQDRVRTAHALVHKEQAENTKRAVSLQLLLV
jgi:hypothetical protein